MPVTMTDIARELGVSQSAVSRVLNGKEDGLVAEDKAAMIKRTANEMGYKINLAAVGLRKRKSYVIGILSLSPRDSFYGKLVADFQHLISRTEYIATFAFWENLEEAEQATKHILSRQVDAIITCEPQFLPQNIKIPVVSYCNYDERFDNVSYDYEYSFRLRVNYLMELGHRNIAYMGDFQDRGRKIAFHKVVDESGLPCPQMALVPLGNYFEEDWMTQLMERFDALWDNEQRPTAVLAQNDVAAILILRRAWERGIKIPEDLSVIGVDNIPQGATCTPSLTTVDNFSHVSAAELLFRKVFERMKESDLPPRKHIVRGELIKRESCASIFGR